MIIGYNRNGEPMFDNPIEYKDWIENKKIEKYNTRNKFEICMDAYKICDEIMEIFLEISFSSSEELYKELLEKKDKFDAEINLIKNYKR